MSDDFRPGQVAPREGYVPLDDASLFFREIGQGRPIIIIHGGPDLDHTYLLPDMDRLSDAYRLIYYDQRGRGKSVGDVQNVTVKSEIEDLDNLRGYFDLESVAVLGHSWGGYLAMEYAIRHPNRVSHMILMNTSVASREDFILFDRERQQRLTAHKDELETLTSSRLHEEGDPKTVSLAYQLYASTTIKRSEHLERLNLDLTHLTKEDVLRAREIEEGLFNETWLNPAFDIRQDLRRVSIPTLILHGDDDFVPLPAVTSIANAITGTHFVLLPECGHFSYIEAPDAVRQAIDAFFAGS